MKKIFITLCLVMMSVLLFAGCKEGNAPTEETEGTEEIMITTLSELTQKGPMSEWNLKTEYTCADGSLLYTYKDKSAQDYRDLCSFLSSAGFSAYSDTQKGRNLASTMTRDSQLVHVYCYPAISELNVVISETAADSLPAQNPAVTDGNVKTTVTQMIDKVHLNGMGYVIQLADGSFIVYDGSYPDRATALLGTMEMLHEGKGKIIIRAWVLTHSHSDHYSAFSVIAKGYAKKIQLEHVIVAPVFDGPNPSGRGDQEYLTTDFLSDAALFEGVKITYAHSGMEFSFCNLKMEILFAAEDLLKNNVANLGFNDTSIVSRLYDKDSSLLVLGDSGSAPTTYISNLYGKYLESDMCQAAHHGGKDTPLSFYETVKASIWFFPCNEELYTTDGNQAVKQGIRALKTTKKCLVAGTKQYVVSWKSLETN